MNPARPASPASIPPSPSNPNPDPHKQTLRQRINRRTQELAVRAGRTSAAVRQADYEQAKRELTGETDPDRQSAVINLSAMPNPPPASTGSNHAGT